MKKLFTLLFLCAITTLAMAQDHVVLTVGSTAFNPTNLTITVGETVEWQNTGGSHNVNGTTATFPNNPESFGNAVGAGWTFQHTFMTEGTYDYQCDPHVGLGMIGTVTVMPAAMLPAYAIGLVTGDSDMNGEADSVGVACTITGVVHGIDMQGNANVAFTIIDAAGDGIGLFSSNDYGYTVQEGDEVTIDGTISSFNGLAQINPDTIILNSMGNTLSTVVDVSDLDESTESQVVRLVGVTLVDPTQWDGSGSNNIDVTDGTSTWTVRIDSDVADVNALPAPAGTFNVTGIGGQFDNSDPYLDGYQLLPRYAADIEVMMTGCEIGTLTADADMNTQPDSLGVACTIEGTVYGIDMDGNEGLSFTVIDAAGDGINIFNFNDVSNYVVAEGDNVTIEGTVSFFNGLTQFSPDSILVNSSGNALVAATDVTVLDESTESQLVRLTNVTLVDPSQWDNSGSNNIDVTDGTSTWTVRIDSDVADLNALPAPMTAFNITGIGGQFDNSDPYTEGYQLLPRYAADLDIIPTGAPALYIAGVADPQPSDGGGGNTAGPKMVELYVLEDIADLSIYGVGVANNGGGSDGVEFTFPAVPASAGDCITYTDSLNATNFETFFGFAPTFLVPSGGVSAAGHNGDDAIELFENGNVIDVFGDPNVDGSGTTWEYLDGWAYRNFGEMANGGVFDETKWSYSGVDALQDNANTMNSEYANPFPTCTYALTPPPSYGVYDIGLVTADSDGNGVGDSLGVFVEITGVVYGIDMQGNDNIQFTMIDANNDGISLFSTNNFGYTVTEGDEITVRGVINHFNGLTQIGPDELTVNSSGNALVTPTDVADLDESTESQLVRLTNVTLVDPTQWDGMGSNNIDVTDGTNTWTVRIDSDVADVNALPAPTGLINVTGLGGQFDSSEPWTEGYQLLPRYAADIEFVDATINLELGNKIKMFPNPVNDNLQIRMDIQFDNIRITNMLGQKVTELQNPNLNETVNVNNWQSGIYVITFISGDEIYTSQFVKQ